MPEDHLTNCDEIWKPIPGYEAVYEVSNFGRVRRIKRSKGTRVGKILGLKDYKSQMYLMADLSSAGIVRRFPVHQLVAFAFIGPRPSGKEINHIDNDPHNNRPENLEYVTHKRNMEHCVASGRINQGETNGQTTLTAAEVRLIRELDASGWTPGALIEHFGVKRKTIYNIRKRRTWKHLS